MRRRQLAADAGAAAELRPTKNSPSGPSRPRTFQEVKSDYLSETGLAGSEHLDDAYVAGYDPAIVIRFGGTDHFSLAEIAEILGSVLEKRAPEEEAAAWASVPE